MSQFKKSLNKIVETTTSSKKKKGTGGGHESDDGDGKRSGASMVTLKYQNYCELCLQYWPDDGRISELIKKNPKKIKDFQIILSYLTGADGTEDKIEEEFAKKGVPQISTSSLPQLCPHCYQTVADIDRLHKDLIRAQKLIQKQTLKARLIVIKTRVRDAAHLSSANERFENGLQFCGMTKEEVTSAKDFVNSLHNVIINEGTNGLTFPSTLPAKFTDANNFSTATNPEKFLPNSQPPSTSATTGILIPVKIVTSSSSTDISGSSTTSPASQTLKITSVSSLSTLSSSASSTKTTSSTSTQMHFTVQPSGTVKKSFAAIAAGLINSSETVDVSPPVSVKRFRDEGEDEEEKDHLGDENGMELDTDFVDLTEENDDPVKEEAFILPDDDDDDGVHDNSIEEPEMLMAQTPTPSPGVVLVIPGKDSHIPSSSSSASVKEKCLKRSGNGKPSAQDKQITQNCDICAKSFYHLDMLKHMESHVKAYARKCLNPECKQVYANIFRLENHLRHVNNCREFTSLPRTSKEQIRLCIACGFQTNVYRKFCRHIKEHEEKVLQKTFPCPIPTCEESFGLRLSVEIHLESHCLLPQ